MSTRKSSNNVFYSAIHLTIALFVIAMGSAFLMIPYSVDLRVFITEKPDILFYIGLSIIALGFALLIGFLFMYRKRYIQVRMGTTKAVIEEDIIREYVQKYWHELFPNKNVDLDIRICHGQMLEIITSLPEQGKEILERIQNELGVLLARKLGYEKEFILTLIE